MLGLVSYEGSSDEENSNDSSPEVKRTVHSVNTESTSEPSANISDDDDDDIINNNADSIENLKVSSNCSQFHLPTPISHNLKPPLKVGNSSKGVKISIPSLDEFDEEEEEVKPRKAKFTASTKGCGGLFSMLPKPRNEFLATPRQLPSIKNHLPSLPSKSKSTLGQVKIKPSISKTTITSITKVSSNIIDDDEEEDGCDEEGHFFTIPEKASTDDFVPEKSLEEYMKPLVLKKNINSNEERDEATVADVGLQESCTVAHEEESMSVPLESEDIELNNDVLRKLGARKRKGEELIVREVDGSRLMPNAQEWLTKQLSQETAYRPSMKKHEGPTSQQKRKHQITYLAFQAKANELDLKNQWSNNRQSKRQTQSKYGF